MEALACKVRFGTFTAGYRNKKMGAATCYCHPPNVHGYWTFHTSVIDSVGLPIDVSTGTVRRLLPPLLLLLRPPQPARAASSSNEANKRLRQRICLRILQRLGRLGLPSSGPGKGTTEGLEPETLLNVDVIFISPHPCHKAWKHSDCGESYLETRQIAMVLV